MKYRVIDSDSQYENYCDVLEKLVFSSPITPEMQDEINLLTLLIETCLLYTSPSPRDCS